MVTGAEINIIIGVITFVVSISASMFLSGTRWGRVEQTLKDLERDRVRQTDMNSLNERRAKIEGMFTLRLRDPSEHG